jgi:hypothetical protein
MLAALLSLALQAAPPRTTPIVRHEGAPATPVIALAGAPDVVGLCRRLVPAERLRTTGDAVAQGDARAQHERAREEAIVARYEITVPAQRLAFAPYDGEGQRLEVVEPAALRLGDGAATLTASDQLGLPVRVDAGLARRLLAAQRAGRLSLRLVFDLPDDAVCASDSRGRRFALEVEPVEWSWLEGETALAWGVVSADRPGVSAALGAKAVVEVREPLSGSPAARKAVEGRRAELLACYAAALETSPLLDGVLVVDLGPRISVSGDSAGSEELARCVEKALAPLGRGPRASVPVRFELLLPGGAPAEE